MKRSKLPPHGPVQLSLPLAAPARPGLRVIHGGGRRRAAEPLSSPDAVVRVLVETGADLLLRRITPERAQEIERAVSKVLKLFEEARTSPRHAMSLRRELDTLQTLMSESRAKRKAR